jgi:hypothetical protein
VHIHYNIITSISGGSWFILYEKTTMMFPYIRGEGGLQPASFQPLEVDGSEDGVGLHLRSPLPLAAQPLTGLFSQQLGRDMRE